MIIFNGKRLNALNEEKFYQKDYLYLKNGNNQNVFQ